MARAKKIGISLPPEIYSWAAHEVQEGRAQSISALITEGLYAMRGQAELGALIRDLEAEVGELSEEDLARIQVAEEAAREAWRRYLERNKNTGLVT